MEQVQQRMSRVPNFKHRLQLARRKLVAGGGFGDDDSSSSHKPGTLFRDIFQLRLDRDGWLCSNTVRNFDRWQVGRWFVDTERYAGGAVRDGGIVVGMGSWEANSPWVLKFKICV